MGRKKVLFIAPLPPPIHGQSLAAKVFLDEIASDYDVSVVNLTKRSSKGFFSFITRLPEIAKILLQVMYFSRKTSKIYFTISESLGGNLKDLLVYLVCYRKLSRMLVHLHGGAGMIKIMKGNHRLLAKVNYYFLKRLSGIIILGESHRKIFEPQISKEQIHIVPNFAENFLFIHDDGLERKNSIAFPIGILYLSNMIPSKGYNELLEAYLSLEEAIRKKVTLDFAGAFQTEQEENAFLTKIESLNNVRYHGVVLGEEKRKLFHSNHVFCLPTYYPYEGQPISIIEAYASSCAVITTNHSGIRDIFTSDVNGYEVIGESSSSIKSAIESAVSNPSNLRKFARHNHEVAINKFRTSIYIKSLRNAAGLLQKQQCSSPILD